MRLVSLILPLCLLASCGKEEPSTARVPSSLRLDHFELPVTSFPSDQLSSTNSEYIEAVIDGDLMEIYHPNGFLNSTENGQSFEKVVESISRSVSAQHSVPPLLLSATASTKFITLRPVIRSAAEAGIYRVLFLVRSDTKKTGVIRIELPNTGEAIPDIEPFFIRIDDKGQVFTGSGAGSARMDEGPDDRNLEKLNSRLELFAAAAKSCGCEVAPCQIYVDPEANYQRIVDLLSTVRKWDLMPYFTDMKPEPIPRLERIQRKPTPPSSSFVKIRPLGLAPK